MRTPRFLVGLAFSSLLATTLATSGCNDDPSAPAGNEADATAETAAPAKIVVTPTTGLRTTEAGDRAFFTIALSARPTADVTIGIHSSNEKEGTVDKKSVTITTQNWNAPQMVTVTGVDDPSPDGNQAYKIVTAAAVSDDKDYARVDPDDVEVTNTDDDSPGITVTAAPGLKTTEMGDEATFTVRLNTKPSGDVTVGLASSNEKEGVVSPKSLVFTSDNWNAPQRVTVKGVDDDVADGDQPYKVMTAPAKSADKAYEGVDADDPTVTNTDNETAGVTIAATNLATTEAGGTATFTVKLNSQPTGTVTIPITSSNEKEGVVSPKSLVFTSDNWNAPQTVTVTGVDDAVADGPQAYKIVTGKATSSDKGYLDFDADDPSVTNSDDDTAGVTVTPTTGLATTEAGGSATFTVRLNSQPVANVTIPISSSRTTEGAVSPASLIFTAENWNAPQKVTVTGVDDALPDGNQAYKIVLGTATSSDKGYLDFDAADPTVTNTDDETAGITITSATTLVTTEAGGPATFTVRLNSKPTANVTVPISSSNVKEGTVSPASLIFTAENWNAPQRVTVTGVDDSAADGNQAYKVLTAPAKSSDTAYVGLDADDPAVTNIDDETAGVTLSQTTPLVTTEAGGTATFTVRLNTKPTADVTIPLSSSNEKEGTVSPASLVFTADNWNAPQRVTVVGVDDVMADGNQEYKIVTAPAVSADALYARLDAGDATLTNTDDETAGFTIEPIAGLVTTEAGGTATFTVRLNSKPTADVTIPLSSSNEKEGTVSPASLVFTSANWNAPQRVTITGVDDSTADGNRSYKIVVGVATSSDTGYAGRDADDVTLVNADNEVPDCVTTVCGASCVDIEKKYPGRRDGNYLIEPAAAKLPFSVYCHAMTGAPAEYLVVEPKTNYSTFSSVGRCDSCGDYLTFYSKVRFFPATFTLDTKDQTFATGSGGSATCYATLRCVGWSLSFGSAGSCSSTQGVSVIDLGLHPFAIDPGAVIGGGGEGPTGGVRFATNRKSATFVGAGSGCASYGFSDGSNAHPVGGQVLLTYVP